MRSARPTTSSRVAPRGHGGGLRRDRRRPDRRSRPDGRTWSAPPGAGAAAVGRLPARRGSIRTVPGGSPPSSPRDGRGLRGRRGFGRGPIQLKWPNDLVADRLAGPATSASWPASWARPTGSGRGRPGRRRDRRQRGLEAPGLSAGSRDVDDLARRAGAGAGHRSRGARPRFLERLGRRSRSSASRGFPSRGLAGRQLTNGPPVRLEWPDGRPRPSARSTSTSTPGALLVEPATSAAAAERSRARGRDRPPPPPSDSVGGV